MATPVRSEVRKPQRFRFRLWEKKRGRRSTGSKWLGNAGEMLFFAALFLLGLFALSTLLISVLGGAGESAGPVGLGTWLLLLVFGTLIVSGAGGVLYTVLRVGTSAERRSALARRAALLEPSPEVRDRAKQFPTLPNDAYFTDSPGVRLRYRMPQQHPPGLKLLIVAIFALTWNGIVAAMSVLLISLYRSGSMDGLSVAVALLFAPVGVLAIYYLFRLLLAAAAIGPTSVEVSDHPFYPGRAYQLYVAQMGHLSLRSLRVALVCDEEVTYRQGTDTRSESRRVYEQPIVVKRNLKIGGGSAFEWQGELRIPKRMMHSFRASHNAAQWKLMVQGRPQRWDRFERYFPVVIYPPTDST